MLIQLPNGDWVAPEAVTAVRAHAECLVDSVSARVAYCVVVERESGVWSRCVAPNRESVEVLRDQIAEQVNRALYKPEGTP